ncbi:hypothetical protein HMF8227_00879 [Saliniradius amylolyticus]|uniref:Prolyl 4-hydroxylase alpha subunit domain-containing protein n=1 Tax=Saliniradius amylolyticus TaxID=2183582 RepID=A0A2S2E158_9ALTE|nr:2OG-Fe(II) oxygenase [Saliniradius amylolyticus]AWL11374.1 hypothetical protein HMF8227_00879 [Saliniradius amylolyticus]
MSALTQPPLQLNEHAFDVIADALVDKGYAVLPNFLPITLAEGLLQELKGYQEEDFKRAAIGRLRDEHRNQFVRKDNIRWLTPKRTHQQQFLSLMDSLKSALNRRLFMGLFDYECHFAHYPPGAFYKKHLDAFKGRTNRVLSTVCYLNPGWRREEQGQLVIYDPDTDQTLLKVTPLFGQMVIFLSEQFPHEVLPAQRDRYSIAGWFRVNTSINGIIDPSK